MRALVARSARLAAVAGVFAVLAPFALAAESRAARAASPPVDNEPLPTLGGVSAESRVEPRLSEVATRLAGKPVEARCWSAGDWQRLADEWGAYTDGKTRLWGSGGYVRPADRSRVHLAPVVCGPLVNFLYRGTRPKATGGREDLAYAILTLTHEAQHAAGTKQEHVAECYGQQRIRPALRMLGATKDYAAVIARTAWTTFYPMVPPAYQSPECRDGGTLDLNPATRIWP